MKQIRSVISGPPVGTTWRSSGWLGKFHSYSPIFAVGLLVRRSVRENILIPHQGTDRCRDLRQFIQILDRVLEPPGHFCQARH